MTDQIDADRPDEDATDRAEPRPDQPPPSAALIEIEDGLALFLGAEAPEGVDIVPFTFMDGGTRRSLLATSAKAVGFGNLVAQGVNGAIQAQGLVRLAPATLQALKTAVPIVKDGWNLGTLVNGGEFVAQIRWLPAASAQQASIIATMGPALTLMAIQFQLDQIMKVAEHNLELTSTVLEVVRRDQWSAVAGYYNTLTRELGHARQIGEVTDAIFAEVRGYQGELSSQWDAYEKAVRQHIDALHEKVGHRDRQRYLTDNGQAILADAQALLLAQTSWFIYQALRAGHLLKGARTDPQDAKLLENIVANSRALHEETLAATDRLLDDLAREFAIIAELPGKRTFKIGGSARAAKDAANMVRQLQQALASVRGHDARPQPEPLATPSIAVFEEEIPNELARILPLRLEVDERVLALADASCDRWNRQLRDSGWIAVTDRRVLVMKQDSLRRSGAIDIELDVEDIRYVRRRGQKAPTVDVITKDVDLTLEFEPWSKSGDLAEHTERFGELLASFMRLPESEVPKVRSPELGSAPAPLAQSPAPPELPVAEQSTTVQDGSLDQP